LRRLHATVAHLCIAADGRHLQTDQSRREIPLVGVALMVNPVGFPRYRDTAEVLSALINKTLATPALRRNRVNPFTRCVILSKIGRPLTMRQTGSSPVFMGHKCLYGPQVAAL
jgi:hypothetical protein